ncbi:MAG TPA: NAD(P)-dependent alcohol dehydrogenase [Chthoniobacterales bacterium]|nr:NAD(P)-dependent alcohol dehydrogenase [Chthoniobacterales bacterium]
MRVKRILKWSAATILVALVLLGFIAYWTSTNDCNAPIRGEVMKAIKVCEYGVDRLQVAEVNKAVPSDDQVLIKVRAASLNALDVFMIRDTWFGRLFFGLRKPRDTGLGRDVAGQVEAVGKNPAAAGQFKPGDEVFGVCGASLAEYAVSSGRGLVMKPSSVSFEEAASIPLAGLTALQGLREGNIQSGQKVLVNGATGGVGTFAVQIAKYLGAEVTAVCSTRNLDLVRSIGADHVIDYTKEDFTKSDQRYDVIFDNVCNHSFFERRRVLTAKGICVLAGMGGAGVKEGQALGRIAGNLFTARGLSSFTDQKFAQYMTKVSKQDLILLGDLLQAGKVRPVIERTYKLNDAPKAIRQLDAGHARGKLVITIGEESR